MDSELQYKNKLIEPNFKVASWFPSTASSQLAMPLVAFRIAILYCIADDKYITGYYTYKLWQKKVNLLKISCSICKDGQIRTAYQPQLYTAKYSWILWHVEGSRMIAGVCQNLAVSILDAVTICKNPANWSLIDMVIWRREKQAALNSMADQSIAIKEGGLSGGSTVGRI